MQTTSKQNANLALMFLAGQNLVQLDHMQLYNDRASIVRGLLKSFDDVEPEAMCFAAVIGQAIEDSMPNVIFRANCYDPLFSSGVNEVYDAVDFLKSSRVDLYAQILNLDPEHTIRRPWKRLFNKWKRTTGKEVARNIFLQIAKVMSARPEKSAEYSDSRSFMNSPQFKFWCDIVLVLPDTQREEILANADKLREERMQKNLQKTQLRAAA